ncbi:MAG: sigma-70 family RNA polymerase sigma factor [Cyclobacterium sp.]|uniref:sigma-70 family RNA polymerase sigma factor n=1 Tax=unclassified Cyclobacterium TaxID=2615055 RepID=UPI0013D850E7|nr:sigma-70 family RNA polymerase sigma factor [Cyclobacterium sp. SYSU L10401]
MEKKSQQTSKHVVVSEWVNSHGDYLFSWAYHKTGNREVAEDLVQEVFLAAVKNFEGFKEKSSPKTWLLKILNNKIIDHYRKSAKKTVHLDDQAFQFTETLFNANGNWKANGLEEAWSNDTHLLDDPAFNDVMNVCIEDLPPRWRLAVISKYIFDKETLEICQELEISKTNYWQVLHRAKLLLKKCLEINWFGAN